MATATKANIIKVNMGLIEYGDQADVLETLLGSCIGVAVWDATKRIAGLAHVVLPNSRGQQGSPGKFADTAVTAIKDTLVRRGAHPLRMQAKIAGGATMFGKESTSGIGSNNYNAVVEQLAEHRIRLEAEHVGGRNGVYVRFHCDDGSMEVLVSRQVVAIL